MIKLSRRDFSRFTLLAAVGAAVPMSAFAFGGPSGPATIYKKQGAIGELKMNPYIQNCAAHRNHSERRLRDSECVGSYYSQRRRSGNRV